MTEKDKIRHKISINLSWKAGMRILLNVLSANLSNKGIERLYERDNKGISPMDTFEEELMKCATLADEYTKIMKEKI